MSRLSSSIGRSGSLEQARSDLASVTRLARQLVRLRSRAGIDPPGPVLDLLDRWLVQHGLTTVRIGTKGDGGPLAVMSEIPGAHPGPRWVLDACVDTAPFGDAALWTHPPTSGTVQDGWLHGRGAADCKTAAAIFCHLAWRLRRYASDFHGTLTLLFDADEHTGRFGGVRAFRDQVDGDIAGAMIGYPGLHHVVVGCRGFWRARLVVHGTAAHSGRGKHASPPGNAVEKAAVLVAKLSERRIPGSPEPDFGGLSPRLTVTAVRGGEGFSTVPDHCDVWVDVRLTPAFDAAAAERLVRGSAAEVDQHWPTAHATEVEAEESWPAYRLLPDAPVAAALLQAAGRHLDRPPKPKIAGPSNIGNYLASHGIPTTAGFGVAYAGLHGTDERIDLATVPFVQAAYHDAVLELLTSRIASRSPGNW